MDDGLRTEESALPMKSSMKYLIGIILLILLSSIFLFQMSNGKKIVATLPSNGGDIQKIVIGMKNYNYDPNTITVKAGQPVVISLDNSVYGCLRSFTIPAFGIREYLRTPEDTIQFIPTNPGKYTFACSMGMGTGTLIVE